MSQFLKGLNDNQKEAVKSVNGTIQICSVAGSGKTRVLVNRTAYMIIEKGIKPSEILLTTFTKKAATEMIDRLKEMLNGFQLQALTLGTTHSIGYQILKEELHKTGHKQAEAFGKRDGILQGWKHKKLAQDIEKKIENKYSVELEYADSEDSLYKPNLNSYLGYVSNCKNNNISHDEAWNIREMNGMDTTLYREFYTMYEKEKQRQGVIDFDDMLYLTVRLFQEHPDILNKYQKKYKYLMVDEAQDNNLLQYQLIQMLGFPECNLFIVGDDDQSMYKFRGASPESFIEFQKDYQKVKQIFLPLNYRSSSNILEQANKLIKHNRNRIKKELTPAPNNISKDKSVFYNQYNDEDEEAKGTLEQIVKLNKEGYKYKDMACLYRTNAQSRAIEDKLIIHGIPYVLHGGVSFYNRAEIKDLLSYFQLAHDTKNKSAFQRIYNKPNRYLGKAFYDKLEDINRNDPYSAMDEIKYGRWASGCREIENIVETINRKLRQKGTLQDCLKFILENAGYKQWLLDEDFESDSENNKLENISTLEHLLSKFKTLGDLIEHLKSVESNKKVSSDAVQIMTIHKSKGLEFKVVFGLGVSEGILPHQRALQNSFDNDSPIEEERRLLYVLVTRAEKLCFLSSIFSYNGKPKDPSTFIYEMDLQPREINKKERTA